MKKALLFGINDYPGASNDLHGCVNDVNDWDALFKSLGFETLLFLNSQVTRERFTYEVQKLIQVAMPGTEIVIQYSGHGTQVQDAHGDEGPGDLYDEALYLYDGPLIDDKINELLSLICDGVYCTLIFDSCFSGDCSRKINEKPRFKPFIAVLDKKGDQVLLRRRKSIVRSDNPNYVLLSGCDELQTSADALIGEKYHGAFTYFALNTYEKGLSYEDWLDIYKKKLYLNGYEQIPELEGNSILFNRGAFGEKLKKHKCWLTSLFN